MAEPTCNCAKGNAATPPPLVDPVLAKVAAKNGEAQAPTRPALPGDAGPVFLPLVTAQPVAPVPVKLGFVARIAQKLDMPVEALVAVTVGVVVVVVATIAAGGKR